MHIVAECTCPINEQATKQKTYCSTGKKNVPNKNNRLLKTQQYILNK